MLRQRFSDWAMKLSERREETFRAIKVMTVIGLDLKKQQQKKEKEEEE